MKTGKTRYLKDYTSPRYLISEVNLLFDLYDDYARVRSEMIFSSGFQSENSPPLVLNGVDLKLINLEMDGEVLGSDSFVTDENTLTIINPPSSGTLSLEVEIYPQDNTALEGLYRSEGIFCTQNEPEGFRKICYFPDRPDVMAVFTTRIRADKKLYPYLLSNGNLIEKGDLPGGRHFALWHDPFPKPSYIFALVAGDFGVVEDEFRSLSGRTIELKMYVDKGNEKKAFHALESLKKAMKWDEETFGLEYGLDIFMIVAVDAFNFGAMENKGLNIFNSTYALADPSSATDGHYKTIESFVAHEFLHNWSGNRVTCRDWFQLTLKEGLTVFRDNEFSSDLYSRAVKRIEVISGLREVQFAEDSGPLAHPIRPESYISVNNFYTSTVFQKGKEVIKMLDTMIGRKEFRKILIEYFRKFDGQAVTTEDFLSVVETSSGIDLEQFENWYTQAGTPVCHISDEYNEGKQEYVLNVHQICHGAEPHHFPLKLGLLDSSGCDIPLNMESSTLHIRKSEEKFVFFDIKEKPVPSLLRDFSAPVKLIYDYSDDDLIFLLKHDCDMFNRFEAGQRLALKTMEKIAAEYKSGNELKIKPEVIEAYADFINAEHEGHMFCSKVLTMPSLAKVADIVEGYDVNAAFLARNHFLKSIATSHRSRLLETYGNLKEEIYVISPEEAAKRSLKNTCLEYLGLLGGEYRDLVYEQFETADNMTDVSASLHILADEKSSLSDKAFAQFYEKWKDNKQVLNNWFSIQAGGQNLSVYDEVLKLEKDPLFDSKNPNKVRSLFGSFAGNLINFHHSSGRGYSLLADRIIESDRYNPKISAGLTKSFSAYDKVSEDLKTLMEGELKRIRSIESISAGVKEIIDIIRK